MAVARHRIVRREGAVIIEEVADVHVEPAGEPVRLSDETRRRLTSIENSDDTEPDAGLPRWVYLCLFAGSIFLLWQGLS